MAIAWGAVRFFRVTVHLWVIGFVFSALPAAEFLWDHPVSPAFPAHGPFAFFTQAFATWWPSGFALLAVPLLLLLCMRNLLRPARWWSALLVWVLYTSLMNRAWMAGSGGQQLIANLLFWLIFLPADPGTRTLSAPVSILATAAFWIIRLQLILVYLATGLHKITGTLWLDGTAMGVVASDPAYGPGWLSDLPALATVMTYCVLAFQFLFPVAIWFARTRLPLLIIGVVFHLGTAIWIDIPEMGLAFIAAYPIWIGERDAPGWLDR